jgi:hypothetical protein
VGVTLINTAGIAIFGPGSEWFWAMAQFLVLLITGLAIYRQLRAQGSANALQAQAGLVARWESPEMVRLRLAALMAVAASESSFPQALGVVDNFFAEMAALGTHRHLRPTDSWEVWSAEVQFWWAVTQPWIASLRASNSGVYGEFEELAATMARLDVEHRVPNFDPADVGPRTERTIARLILRLQLERDARQGLVPTWPIPESVDGQQPMSAPSASAEPA